MALRLSRRFLSPVATLAVDGARATLTLVNPPVNVLNRKTLGETTALLNDVAQNATVKGLILTGGSGKVFSAGLDITEFASPEEGRLREYWALVQNFWLALYSLEKPTVAAINGAAPAGGTMVGLGCDYRVMVDSPKAKIGLNEAKLGLAAPHWLAMAYWDAFTSRRQAELLTMRGDLLSPQEAVAVGIVDDLVPAEEVMAAANRRLDDFLSVPTESFRLHKNMFRGPRTEHLRQTIKEDTDALVSCVLNEGVQRAITGYLASLQKK